MTPEFALINRYFNRAVTDAEVALGIGDDCAIVRCKPGHELVISTDTLGSGTHFFPDADAEKLGRKALAVNLSDLAAMGATPRFVMLALTMPHIDEAWLDAFSRGFYTLADQYSVSLIGGNTTRGPLSITITILGEIEAGRALRRDTAKLNDDIWVSGSLGAASLALMHIQKKVTLPPNVFRTVEARRIEPNPRVELGRALLGVAHAAIDISDGLLADLGHIAERSRLAAIIQRDAVPMAAGLLNLRADQRDVCALAGGDDYELCFTAPESVRAQIISAGEQVGVAVTRIGKMVSAHSDDKFQASFQTRYQVRVHDEAGCDVTPTIPGFDHFI